MNRNRLDDLSWAMSQVYSGVEDRILINLAKYFPMVQAKGQMTGSFEYQARMLGKMGSVTKDTVAIIVGSLGNADDALRRSLTTAILDALQGEEGKLIAAAQKGLLTGIPGEIAPSMMQAFRMYYKQSADKLNLVNTVMLESTQAAYTAAVTDAAARIQQIQGALNLGAGEVITGVSAWNQAMRTTVQSMVKAGITGYIDHAGRRWSPEAYVAMDIRTTMFNTSRAAVWERNQQYNNDLYQVSSHMGARPLCYPWQGKVLSTSGRTGTTTDLDGNEVVIHSEAEVESFRYGGGLFGVNCGHYPMVFIPGFSTLKDVPQDEEENAKTYAESQQQRALERKLREEKRDLEVMKAQGMGEEAIKAQQERVRRASGDLDTFCEETGRHRDRAREYTPIDAKWPDPSTYDPTKFPTAEREKIREWFANGGRDNPPPLQGGVRLGPDDIPPAAQAQIPITPQNVTSQATTPPPPVVQSISGAKDFSELRTVMQDVYGITVDSAVDSLNFDMVHEAMQGVESMFTKYPALTSTIKTIEVTQHGVMACTGKRITFNPDWFTTRDRINDAIARSTKSHWWPVNTSLQSIAAHECGHGLEWLLIVNDPQFSGALSGYLHVEAWNKCTLASQIVSEAAKAAKKQEYGKGKKVAELVESISRYATKSRSEALAEAYGDVQANGVNAAPFAREVVRVTEELLKRLLGGGTP